MVQREGAQDRIQPWKHRRVLTPTLGGIWGGLWGKGLEKCEEPGRGVDRGKKEQFSNLISQGYEPLR